MDNKVGGVGGRVRGVMGQSSQGAVKSGGSKARGMWGRSSEEEVGAVK